MGTKYDKRIYSVSEDSQGFFVRTGNAFDNIKKFELHKRPNFGSNFTKNSRDKQNA